MAALASALGASPGVASGMRGSPSPLVVPPAALLLMAERGVAVCAGRAGASERGRQAASEAGAGLAGWL